MKKVYLIIACIALIALLTGISELVGGIAARGFGGVNYGLVLFPLLIGIFSFTAYKKQD
ncbi:MAG: hypothetical protein PUA63_04040 [Oscillospiraceae bacterium]|nr:hypothetical protein [Oscillospiraceae bacterium]